jgi:TNF receptor-associated factor 2/TNF receptor-associated factor 3
MSQKEEEKVVEKKQVQTVQKINILKMTVELDLSTELCGKCQHIVTIAFCNECNKHFCDNCVSFCTVINEQYIEQCPEGHQVERREWEKVIVSKIQDQLLCTCPYPGCNEKYLLYNDLNFNNDLFHHIQGNCDKVHHLCRVCQQMALNVQKHQEEDCPKRKVVCKGCKKEMTSEAFDTHFERCELYPVDCTFCKKNIIRKNIKPHHFTDCPTAVLNCDICNFSGKLKEWKQHIQKEPYTKLHIDHLISLECQSLNDNVQTKQKKKEEEEKKE